MNILDEIIAHKKKEVVEKRSLYPSKLLEQSIYFEGDTVSMKGYIQRADKSGIIAEFKRRSPSKGVINPNATVEQVSIGYMQAGASGLSVLTDKKYFGGKNEDLTTARKYNFCPILRKDFVVDEYQIIEAKSIGADTILLIAAALTSGELKSLGAFAKSFGLEVLMEVHNEEELNKCLNENIDLLGVNNRNLKTFETSIQVSKDIADKIPSDFVKVSESGISDPNTINELKTYGYEGFLIGENFMRNGRPARAAKDFIDRLKVLEGSGVDA